MIEGLARMIDLSMVMEMCKEASRNNGNELAEIEIVPPKIEGAKHFRWPIAAIRLTTQRMSTKKENR